MAFITDATRKVVIDHAVATLGRAPSAAELAAITKLLNNNASLADVADYLTSSDGYLAKYPLGQTAKEVAADILDAAIVGGVLAADIRLAAIDIIAGGLTAGTYTIASATNAVVAYLSDTANNDNADLGDIAKAFQNRTAAAEEFTTTFTLEGATVTEADLAAAVEGVTSDAATLTAAKAAFAAGSKSIAAQAAADEAAEEKAAEEKAAEEKAAEEKAAEEKAAEEKAAEEKAAETPADKAAALATALETATKNDTDAKAALETATEAYDAAIAGGDPAAVVTANGNKLIAQDKADKAAAALVEATTASEENDAAAEKILTDAVATAKTAAETAVTDSATANTAAAEAIAAITDNTTAAAALVKANAADTAATAATEAVATYVAAAAKTADEDDDTAAETLSTTAATQATAATDSVTEATAEVAIDRAPQVFELTTGVDNGASFTGGTGADSFVATAATAALTTLTPGDALTGGKGTDTLSITASTAGGNTLGAGVTTSSVESVSVNSVTATTLDATLMTGVTDLYNNGSLASLSVSNLSAIPNVHLVGTSADTTVAMTATSTVSTADAMTVALSSAATTANANLTAQGIETFNVLASVASGSAATSQTLTSSSARSVAITGDASTSITVNLAGAGATEALTGSVTGNAAANTMNVTADVADFLSVDLGGGNDALILPNGIGENYTLAGGEGVNVLSLTQAGATATDAKAAISDFDVLNISNAGTGTIDMDDFEGGFSKVIYDAGLGGATTVDDAVTGIEVEVDVTAVAQNLTVDLKTDGAADAITVTLDAIGAGDAIGTINAADAETLTISVDDDTTTATGTIAIAGITLGDATSVVLSGDAATTITTFTNPTTAVLTSFDASGMTDDLTMSGLNLAAAGATITLGSGDDSVTMGTGDGADTIDLTAGGDNTIAYTAVGQSDAAAMDVIKGFVSGSDDIDLTGLGVINAALFGGVGASRTAAEGLLGGTNNAIAVYQADDNVLWVDSNASGTLNAGDFRVELEGVATIVATDLGVTGKGAGIALTDAGASVVNTTTNTNASAVSTNEADTVTSTLAAANGAVVDTAGGVDSLSISDDITGAGTVNLTNEAGGAVLDIDLNNAESVIFNGQTGLVNVGTNNNGENITVNGEFGALTATFAAADQEMKVTNTGATNASTITFGAFEGQVATTGAADDAFNASADGFTASGGSGADTFNITNVAVYDNDAVLASFVGGDGVDSLVFADALTVAVDFTDTTDISVSSIETLDLGAVGGASTADITGTAFTTLTADTAGGTVTITTDIASFASVEVITNTDGTEVFDLTFSDAGSINLESANVDISGGAGNIDVITLAAGANTLTIDSTSIGDIGGNAVAAGADDILVITDTSTITDNVFNAFETITISGTGDIDVTDSALDLARTINGNSGDNDVTLTGAISAIKTVDLSDGGDDTVVVSMDATSYATVSGFDAGALGDVFNLLTAGDVAADVAFSGPVVATGFTATTAATDASNGVVLASAASQIVGALTQVGDAGAVESAIIAAGLIGIDSTADDGEFLMVALDNGTDTGIYRVQVNAGADVDFTDADDMDNITLIGILEGVTADQLVAANII